MLHDWLCSHFYPDLGRTSDSITLNGINRSNLHKKGTKIIDTCFLGQVWEDPNFTTIQLLGCDQHYLDWQSPRLVEYF